AKEKSYTAVCLSNERQIGLRFRMLVDQCGSNFDDPAVAEWHTNEAGRAGGPWICPSAPERREASAYTDGYGATWGTVRSAWEGPITRRAASIGPQATG